MPLASVPITAGPTVPIVNIGDATLSAIPGKRWQVVLYLQNNSANTVVPMLNCRFTNSGRLVEETHVLVPAVGAGLRVGMVVYGPKTDLFVDRANCGVKSPESPCRTAGLQARSCSCSSGPRAGSRFTATKQTRGPGRI